MTRLEEMRPVLQQLQVVFDWLDSGAEVVMLAAAIEST